MISPIGLVAAAITGLIAVGYLFRQEVGEAFRQAGEFISGKVLPRITDTLESFGEFASGIFTGISNGITSALRGVLEIIKTVTNKILDAGKWIADALGIDTGPLERSRDLVVGILDEMGDGIKNKFDVVGTFVGETFDDLEGFGRGAADNLGAAWDEVAKRIGVEAGELETVLQDAFTFTQSPVEDDSDSDPAETSTTWPTQRRRRAIPSRRACRAQGRAYTDSIGDAVVQGKNLLDSLANVARQVLSDIVSGLAKTALIKAGLGGLFGFPGLATGGRLQPGVPTLVGERGPEIVSSNRPMTVTNAADARSAARGSGGAVNQEFNFGMVFPPQLEAFVRNVAAPAGRQAAFDIMKAREGVL
ncbi:MAG: hypothetical protein U5O39_03410 [Gammaproteobacteria bacterium]|nr:hypothetical protein [Gammaproteobacteria bacterium]